MKSTPLSTRPAATGFTLAEVMIAMGIVASVMVAILGLMSLAVKSVQESSNLTMQGRIAQEVINNIQMAEWEDLLTSYSDQSFKFDNEGFLLGKGDENKATPIFEARIRFPDNAVQLGDIEYDLSVLRRVLIEVEFTPGGVRMSKAADRKRAIKTFNFYVANQNKLPAKAR